MNQTQTPAPAAPVLPTAPPTAANAWESAAERARRWGCWYDGLSEEQQERVRNELRTADCA